MSLAMFKGPTVAGPTQNRSVMLGGRHDRDGDDALDWSIGAGRGWRKLSGYPGGGNRRTDSYGGSIENCSRLLLQVTQAIISEIGANRTGVRISPVTPANGTSTSDPQSLFDHIVTELRLAARGMSRRSTLTSPTMDMTGRLLRLP